MMQANGKHSFELFESPEGVTGFLK
jgi:hypothetical protein